LMVAIILGWIAATLTLWSGIDYFLRMSRRVS
jgi:phosphatidylglycerophosphate synthase